MRFVLFFRSLSFAQNFFARFARESRMPLVPRGIARPNQRFGFGLKPGGGRPKEATAT